MKTLKPLNNIFALAFLISALTAFSFAQTATIKFSTEEEIKADVGANVCKDGDERREAVKTLFGKMGAAADDIKVETFKDAENVVVTKKGKTDETIIVGAHYDKTKNGCGAIDNWTGVVIVANLYRTIKQFDTEKTYVFVAFGKEEAGLIGSDRMARAIPKEKRANYCAMLNLDSFGLAYPQAMTNISDAKLIDVAKEVAKELRLPFAEASIENASSDSESFRKQKIPAISIHGLSNKWQDYLHGERDKTENVIVSSVYIGYRFGLNYLVKIDIKGCADFRK